jgi:branched-chain amino acid transport system substrate-binding protein
MDVATLFRMIGRDDLQGKLAAQRIVAQHAGQKLGILRFVTDYSVGLTGAVISELAVHGIEPTLIVDGITSASSYLDDITQFIDAGIEVLYLVGGGLDSGVIVRQARQIDAPFSIISSDTLVSNIFTETAGAAGDGIPFTFPSEAVNLSETETTRDAIAAIRAMGVEPSGFTLLSYAAAEVWLSAVRRAGTTEANAVAVALRQAPITTVMGMVSFDHKGDIQTQYPAYSWFVWRDGERVAID